MKMKISIWALLLFVLISLSEAAGTPVGRAAVTEDRIPLIDMGDGTYFGFTGALYHDGSNAVPRDHRRPGQTRGRRVVPRDQNGNPSETGKYVLLSIGMSNTTQEFCSQSGFPPCDAWTFTGQALADPDVNGTHLVIANGAKGGQDAATWDAPDDPNYDRVRDQVLAPLGLTERQVQVIWLKEADARPPRSLPDPNADAFVLERHLGNIVRAAKVRYVNLQQFFLSSRIYGGYASGDLNPEPFAYESGFSVKWIVQAQIDQIRNGEIVDPNAGDLDYRTGVAPWIAWAAYLWADGLNPRSDGLIWRRQDFAGDGTHPSQSGEQKVGKMLLSYLKGSRVTRCWFVVGGTCP